MNFFDENDEPFTAINVSESYIEADETVEREEFKEVSRVETEFEAVE